MHDAIENNLGYISLDRLLPDINSVFALRISGHSMKNDGINDGDFVLLADDDVLNGDIGAVIYNGETTLKRIFFENEGLRLVPANELFSDIVIKPGPFDEVKIAGRYIGHIDRNGVHLRRGVATLDLFED